MRAFFRPGPSRRVGSRSSSTISFKLTDGYKRCVDVTDRKTPVTSNLKKTGKKLIELFCHRNIDRRRSAGKFRRQVKKKLASIFFRRQNFDPEFRETGLPLVLIALLAPSLGCMREMKGGRSGDWIPTRISLCVWSKRYLTGGQYSKSFILLTAKRPSLLKLPLRCPTQPYCFSSQCCVRPLRVFEPEPWCGKLYFQTRAFEPSLGYSRLFNVVTSLNNLSQSLFQD